MLITIMFILRWPHNYVCKGRWALRLFCSIVWLPWRLKHFFTLEFIDKIKNPKAKNSEKIVFIVVLYIYKDIIKQNLKNYVNFAVKANYVWPKLTQISYTCIYLTQFLCRLFWKKKTSIWVFLLLACLRLRRLLRVWVFVGVPRYFLSRV